MKAESVLLIDDDLDSRVIYRAALEQAGYAVLEAPDGERGIQLAFVQVPDLVLLDLCLPVMDGWAVAERLKHDPRTAGIPICAVTAQALTSEDCARAEAIGFVACLTKPVGPAEVLQAVAHWVGGDVTAPTSR